MTQAKHTFFVGGLAALFLTASAHAELSNAPTEAAVAHTQDLSAEYIKAEPLHRTANLSYQVAGKRYTPQKKVGAFSQTGKASWYGPGFHGKKTASGERFNMNALTAAHRTLPIPSYVKVTNLSNGREVVVKINDRGPFHGNRVLDLSKAAAHKLGFVHQGSANVKIEQIVPSKKAI